MRERLIKGTDPDFQVVWVCADQRYIVRYKGKVLRYAYKFSDIKSYL